MVALTQADTRSTRRPSLVRAGLAWPAGAAEVGPVAHKLTESSVLWACAACLAPTLAVLETHAAGPVALCQTMVERAVVTPTLAPLGVAMVPLRRACCLYARTAGTKRPPGGLVAAANS